MPKYRTKWTRNAVEEAAKGFRNGHAFQLSYPGAARAAQYEGYWKELTSKMPQSQEKWDYDKVKAEAQKYTVKGHFISGCSGGSKWARRHGVLDEICSHMIPHARSDFDAVYLWKLKDMGEVYKIGVTSHRLGDKRIKFVSRMSGYDVEYYLVRKMDDAVSVESEMLKLGKPFLGVDCSGATEFRQLDPQELNKCLRLMGINTFEEYV